MSILGRSKVFVQFHGNWILNYAWLFYCQNHPVYSYCNASHFHIRNKGYLFDFMSTYAIFAPVIFHFAQFFTQNHISPVALCNDIDIKKIWDFLAHLLIHIKSLSRDVHLPKRPRKSQKNGFSMSNSHGIGSSLVSIEMIIEALPSATQILASFTEFDILRNSGIQPNHLFLVVLVR